MLERCRNAHPEIMVKPGSFTEIPFEDGSFDIVVSSFTYHEVLAARRRDACAEVARVLRPQAQFALLDIMFASDNAIDDARQCIGSSWDFEEQYPLVGDVDGTLRSAGFTNIHWAQSADFHWIVIAKHKG